MKRQSYLRDESGAAQILTALAFGIVLVTGALYSLQFSSMLQVAKLRQIRKSELRTAVWSALDHARAIYQREANCDPNIFHHLLWRMNQDGSIGSTTSRRVLNVNVGRNTYPVSIGTVQPLTAAGAINTDPTVRINPPQDVVVEAWATSVQTKVVQRAILINNCTYPCAVILGDTNSAEFIGLCTTAEDANIAFHSISTPATYGVATGCGTGGAFRFGNIAATSCGPDSPNGSVDMADLVILKNYLRSGDLSGTCSNLMIGDGAGTPGCADLNQDSLVDEIDLSIFEKVLRGYLWSLPAI